MHSSNDSGTADKLRKLIINVIEVTQQAQHDFLGEQKEWHLPRLRNIDLSLRFLYPTMYYDAMLMAKTPYGGYLVEVDEDVDTEGSK